MERSSTLRPPAGSDGGVRAGAVRRDWLSGKRWEQLLDSLWSGFDGASAARVLRRCTRHGTQTRLLGTPHIENRGTLLLGDDVTIASKPVQTHFVVHRGALLNIGDRVRFGHGAGVACHQQIAIGAGTSIGAFTLMLDSDYHVAGDPSKRPEPTPIQIGRDVQIGSHVTILRGSTIADGAVIESGSVVSGEIEAGTRVSGVPARPILVPGTRAAQGQLTTESRIASVAKACFRLPALPSLSAGVADVPRWDSLGTLHLVLALEEEFGVIIDHERAYSFRRLSDFVSLLAPQRPHAP